jgi:hypothetical protein
LGEIETQAVRFERKRNGQARRAVERSAGTLDCAPKPRFYTACSNSEAVGIAAASRNTPGSRALQMDLRPVLIRD